MKAILYEANGEASDWMLGKYGIIAMSPELGILDKRSEGFFLDDALVLKETIFQNQLWVFNTIIKVQP